MKKTIFYILFVCLFISNTMGYTYVITTYQTLPDLSGTQSMLITGNGGGGLTNLFDSSSITVESTSTLEQGVGGVWEIQLMNKSSLYMTGGQVHEINIGNNATAVLKGGLIESIWSTQIVPDPHITLYYSGTLPTVQKIGGFNYLVGNWGNGDPFSIYLHNTGYNVYGNFNFVLVPEPATLVLFALGTLLLRRKQN